MSNLDKLDALAAAALGPVLNETGLQPHVPEYRRHVVRLAYDFALDMLDERAAIESREPRPSLKPPPGGIQALPDPKVTP